MFAHTREAGPPDGSDEVDTGRPGLSCVGKAVGKKADECFEFFRFRPFLAFPREKIGFSGVFGCATASLGFRAGFAGFFRWLGDSPPAGKSWRVPA